MEPSMLNVSHTLVAGAIPIPSITRLTDAVETLLTDSVADLPWAARQRLILLTPDVLLAGGVTLRRIATTHAHIAGGAGQAASHERWLRLILIGRVREGLQVGVQRRCAPTCFMRTGRGKTAWMTEVNIWRNRVSPYPRP